MFESCRFHLTNSFIFFSSILNSLSSIQYKFHELDEFYASRVSTGHFDFFHTVKDWCIDVLPYLSCIQSISIQKKSNTYFDLLYYWPSLTAYVSNLSNCQIFISGHLMSDYFEFQVVSGWVGSGIGLSSIGSFWISDRIRSNRIEYQVI
jgi:hypothetical protein